MTCAGAFVPLRDHVERARCWRCGTLRPTYETCMRCGGSCKPHTERRQREQTPFLLEYGETPNYNPTDTHRIQ